METSKETYKTADHETRMNILYDSQEYQSITLGKILKMLKGNGKKGLITDLEILKSRVMWLTIFCFSLVGLIKWG